VRKGHAEQHGCGTLNGSVSLDGWSSCPEKWGSEGAVGAEPPRAGPSPRARLETPQRGKGSLPCGTGLSQGWKGTVLRLVGGWLYSSCASPHGFLNGRYRGCNYQSAGVLAAHGACFWGAEAEAGIRQKLQKSAVLIGRSEVGKGFAAILATC